MPEQPPLITTEELMKMYNQQNPGAAPPSAPPMLDQAGINAAGGTSPAMSALSQYNQFLSQQQQPNQTAPAGPPPTAGNFGQGPQRAGGNPPPQAFGGGITPSVGLENGNSLPQASGGHNMRIQNGTRIQDVGFSPTAGGGMNATTMRDASTGLTFNQGPNGQFYPAGSVQGGPGMSFDNAQTNVIQTGREAADAQTLGLSPDPATLDGLRQARLMGAPPDSPIGQRVIAQAIDSYNQRQQQTGLLGMQNQNKIDLANIAMDPLKNMQLEYGKGLSALAARGASPEEIADYIGNMNRAMSNATAMRGQTPMTGMPGPGVAPPPVPGIAGGGTAGPVGGGVAARPSPLGQGDGTGSPAMPGMPADLADLYEMRKRMFGPEIAQALAKRNSVNGQLVPGQKPGDFAVPTNALMTMMYQYDRSHPGTMKTYGRDFMDAMNASRGDQSVRQFMQPAPLAETFYLNEPDDEAQARSAFRHFTGTPQKQFLMNGLIDRMMGGTPAAGPVIAGSPAAQKAIEAMNKADRGKGLPARRGRAGTE